jgi:hypothetical protein
LQRHFKRWTTFVPTYFNPDFIDRYHTIMPYLCQVTFDVHQVNGRPMPSDHLYKLWVLDAILDLHAFFQKTLTGGDHWLCHFHQI